MLNWRYSHRTDAVIPLGAFGLGYGVTMIPVLGNVCVGRLRSVSAGQDSDRQVSSVDQLFVGVLDGGDWFWCALVSLGVGGVGGVGRVGGVGGVAVPGLIWALQDWAGLFSWFIVLCAGEIRPTCSRELVNGGESSSCVFLFKLPLIPLCNIDEAFKQT